MSNDDLTLWFNEVLWPSYGELVKTPFSTKYKSGSKGEALKKILTLKPNGDLQNRIAAALVEQRKHRKKLFEQVGSMQKYLEVTAYDKFYANRMCSTWLNQMGWEDEIPPLDDITENKSTLFGNARCQHSDCPNPIHGPSYVYCFEHESRTPESDKTLKQKLRELQLVRLKDESLHDYAMRCKKKALQLMRGLGNGMRMPE
jgi:hypothetical protein